MCSHYKIVSYLTIVLKIVNIYAFRPGALQIEYSNEIIGANYGDYGNKVSDPPVTSTATSDVTLSPSEALMQVKDPEKVYDAIQKLRKVGQAEQPGKPTMKQYLMAWVLYYMDKNKIYDNSVFDMLGTDAKKLLRQRTKLQNGLPNYNVSEGDRDNKKPYGDGNVTYNDYQDYNGKLEIDDEGSFGGPNLNPAIIEYLQRPKYSVARKSKTADKKSFPNQADNPTLRSEVRPKFNIFPPFPQNSNTYDGSLRQIPPNEPPMSNQETAYKFNPFDPNLEQHYKDNMRGKIEASRHPEIVKLIETSNNAMAAGELREEQYQNKQNPAYGADVRPENSITQGRNLLRSHAFNPMYTGRPGQMNIPANIPSHMPGSMPGYMPGNKPNNMPGSMPAYIPGNVQSNIPGNMPDNFPGMQRGPKEYPNYNNQYRQGTTRSGQTTKFDGAKAYASLIKPFPGQEITYVVGDRKHPPEFKDGKIIGKVMNLNEIKNILLNPQTSQAGTGSNFGNAYGNPGNKGQIGQINPNKNYMTFANHVARQMPYGDAGEGGTAQNPELQSQGYGPPVGNAQNSGSQSQGYRPSGGNAQNSGPQNQGYGPPEGNAPNSGPQNQGYGPGEGNPQHSESQSQGYGPPGGNSQDSGPQNQGYGPPEGNAQNSGPQNQGYGPGEGNPQHSESQSQNYGPPGGNSQNSGPQNQGYGPLGGNSQNSESQSQGNGPTGGNAQNSESQSQGNGPTGGNAQQNSESHSQSNGPTGGNAQNPGSQIQGAMNQEQNTEAQINEQQNTTPQDLQNTPNNIQSQGSIQQGPEVKSPDPESKKEVPGSEAPIPQKLEDQNQPNNPQNAATQDQFHNAHNEAANTQNATAQNQFPNAQNPSPDSQSAAQDQFPKPQNPAAQNQQTTPNPPTQDPLPSPQTTEPNPKPQSGASEVNPQNQEVEKQNSTSQQPAPNQNSAAPNTNPNQETSSKNPEIQNQEGLNGNPETASAAGDTVYDMVPGWYEMEFTSLSPMTSTANEEVTILADEALLPTPSPVSPLVEETKKLMTEQHMGYFTAYIIKLLEVVEDMDSVEAVQMFSALKDVLDNMVIAGKLNAMGNPAVPAIQNVLNALILYGPAQIKGRIRTIVLMIRDKENALSEDLRTIINIIDAAYTMEEGERLLNTLNIVQNYPANNLNQQYIAQTVVNTILLPYWRTEGTPNRAKLFEMINAYLKDNFRFIARRHEGKFRKMVVFNKEKEKKKAKYNQEKQINGTFKIVNNEERINNIGEESNKLEDEVKGYTREESVTLDKVKEITHKGNTIQITMEEMDTKLNKHLFDKINNAHNTENDKRLDKLKIKHTATDKSIRMIQKRYDGRIHNVTRGKIKERYEKEHDKQNMLNIKRLGIRPSTKRENFTLLPPVMNYHKRNHLKVKTKNNLKHKLPEVRHQYKKRQEMKTTTRILRTKLKRYDRLKQNEYNYENTLRNKIYNDDQETNNKNIENTLRHIIHNSDKVAKHNNHKNVMRDRIHHKDQVTKNNFENPLKDRIYNRDQATKNNIRDTLWNRMKNNDQETKNNNIENTLKYIINHSDQVGKLNNHKNTLKDRIHNSDQAKKNNIENTLRNRIHNSDRVTKHKNIENNLRHILHNNGEVAKLYNHKNTIRNRIRNSDQVTKTNFKNTLRNRIHNRDKVAKLNIHKNTIRNRIHHSGKVTKNNFKNILRTRIHNSDQLIKNNIIENTLSNIHHNIGEVSELKNDENIIRNRIHNNDQEIKINNFKNTLRNIMKYGEQVVKNINLENILSYRINNSVQVTEDNNFDNSDNVTELKKYENILKNRIDNYTNFVRYTLDNSSKVTKHDNDENTLKNIIHNRDKVTNVGSYENTLRDILHYSGRITTPSNDKNILRNRNHNNNKVTQHENTLRDLPYYSGKVTKLDHYENFVRIRLHSDKVTKHDNDANTLRNKPDNSDEVTKLDTYENTLKDALHHSGKLTTLKNDKNSLRNKINSSNKVTKHDKDKNTLRNRLYNSDKVTKLDNYDRSVTTFENEENILRNKIHSSNEVTKHDKDKNILRNRLHNSDKVTKIDNDENTLRNILHNKYKVTKLNYYEDTLRNILHDQVTTPKRAKNREKIKKNQKDLERREKIIKKQDKGIKKNEMYDKKYRNGTIGATHRERSSYSQETGATKSFAAIDQTTDNTIEQYKMKTIDEKNITRNEKTNSLLKKIIQESSYSDDERELKTILSDAVRHTDFVFKNFRNNEIVIPKRSINEMSSYSDEEAVFKSRIYKTFGYEPDLGIPKNNKIK